MNSLTPISSLAATAQARVVESLARMPGDDAARAGLEDAVEALETLARRSDGLLHFVHNNQPETLELNVDTACWTRP